MTIKSIAGRISLLLPFLFEVEAFDLHLGGRKSPLNINRAEEPLGGVTKLQGHRQIFGRDGECHSNMFGSSSASENADKTGGITGLESSHRGDAQGSRNKFLLDCRTFLTVGLVASVAASFPEASNAKLYSENAANLERINNGDFSGGAVFNNNPDTERGKKRRAMTGCKVALSREEASTNILKRTKMLSEKECNTMVMEGETEFMLQALRNLDCPTCANGIGKIK